MTTKTRNAKDAAARLRALLDVDGQTDTPYELIVREDGTLGEVVDCGYDGASAAPAPVEVVPVSVSPIDETAEDEPGAGQPSSADGEPRVFRVPPSIVSGIVPRQGLSREEKILATRRALESGDGLVVNSDGTAIIPGSDEERSSIAEGTPLFTAPSSVVAAPTQWYVRHPNIQRVEIEAMRRIRPNARPDFLDDGKMCWTLEIAPKNALGHRRRWVFLAVYDDDHPQKRYGGSVKFYPVSPNYEEMLELVRRSHVTPKRIPHMLPDDRHLLYLCTQDKNRIQASTREGDTIDTAASGLLMAMHWVDIFEQGLIDQVTWTNFQEEGVL